VSRCREGPAFLGLSPMVTISFSAVEEEREDQGSPSASAHCEGQ
jgi:hypothetical protein